MKICHKTLGAERSCAIRSKMFRSPVSHDLQWVRGTWIRSNTYNTVPWKVGDLVVMQKATHSLTLNWRHTAIRQPTKWKTYEMCVCVCVCVCVWLCEDTRLSDNQPNGKLTRLYDCVKTYGYQTANQMENLRDCMTVWRHTAINQPNGKLTRLYDCVKTYGYQTTKWKTYETVWLCGTLARAAAQHGLRACGHSSCNLQHHRQTFPCTKAIQTQNCSA